MQAVQHLNVENGGLDEPTAADLFAGFKQPLDPSQIKERYGFKDRQGNVHNLSYIEWHTAADILDQTCPDWAHSVKDIREIAGCVVVTVAVTCFGVTREGVGTSLIENDPEMCIKGAEHDALKRAAVKFGIGRELYHKDGEPTEGGGGGQQFQQTKVEDVAGSAMAQNAGDLISAKQLGMIRAICNQINIDPDEECQTVLGCRIDELSKKGASAFIDHVKTAQESGYRGGFNAPAFQPPPDRSAPSQGGTPFRQQAPVPQAQNAASMSQRFEAMTEGQGRALFAISKLHGTDPNGLAQAEYGINEDELSKQQASDIIQKYGSGGDR